MVWEAPEHDGDDAVLVTVYHPYRRLMATRTERSIKRLRSGDLLAEVEVELRYEDGKDYGPTVPLSDALRIERVFKALERGDAVAAARDARVYHLTPVGASS